jgi:peptide/nickel transport system permease protein
MLIYLFGLYLHWLPTQGYTSPFDDFGMAVKQMILPVFVLPTGALFHRP